DRVERLGADPVLGMVDGPIAATTRRGVAVSLRIVWSRAALLEDARRLERAVDRLVAWWRPFGVREVRWRMDWGVPGLPVARAGAPTVAGKSEEDTLLDPIPMMIHYAEQILNCRRAPAVAPRAFVALEPAGDRPVHKAAREVVLAFEGMDRFLVNVR